MQATQTFFLRTPYKMAINLLRVHSRPHVMLVHHGPCQPTWVACVHPWPTHESPLSCACACAPGPTNAGPCIHDRCTCSCVASQCTWLSPIGLHVGTRSRILGLDLETFSRSDSKRLKLIKINFKYLKIS